jgi:hypothetical protein
MRLFVRAFRCLLGLHRIYNFVLDSLQKILLLIVHDLHHGKQSLKSITHLSNDLLDKHKAHEHDDNLSDSLQSEEKSLDIEHLASHVVIRDYVHRYHESNFEQSYIVLLVLNPDRVFAEVKRTLPKDNCKSYIRLVSDVSRD